MVSIKLTSVLHIKSLEEDKVKHKTTLKLLKRICEEVTERNSTPDIAHNFYKATIVATIKDNPQVIQEVLAYFPQAIWSSMGGYGIIQMAIISRSENVYNLLVHQMRVNISLHKVLKDKDQNNLLHLAAKLPPIHKLNEVSGAALQMQREMQWYKVKILYILNINV